MTPAQMNATITGFGGLGICLGTERCGRGTIWFGRLWFLSSKIGMMSKQAVRLGSEYNPLDKPGQLAAAGAWFAIPPYHLDTSYDF